MTSNAVQALLLRTNGTFEKLPLAGTQKFKTLQKALGGSCETLPSKSTVVTAYVNEEGVLKNLTTNLFSGRLLNMEFYVNWDYGGVRGNVVLLGPPDKDGEATSVPASVVKQVTAYSERLQEDTESE